MAEESNVVTINGTDYNPDDLSDAQKYIILQVKDLQKQANNLRFQLDQVNASLNSFTNSLISELEKSPQEQED